MKEETEKERERERRAC